MMSVRLMLHFWWSPMVLVFWTVVQPPSLVALRVQRLFFSKIHENDTRIPDVDPFGGRSFNFGDGASSKATSLSRLRVRNEASGDFWVPVHLFADQPEPTPLMLDMDFLKKHLCVVNYGEDLIQSMQSECWWPLFCVESRFVLHATLRSALGAFITNTMTNY